MLGQKGSHLGFCVTEKFCPELGRAVLRRFLNMNGTQDATVRSSIGTPEVVWRVVKYTQIILKLAKL